MNKAIRNRLIITLVLAVIVALATYKYLNSLTEVTEIVVANQEIPPRTQITAEMLATKTVHVDVLEVMPNLFTSPDEVIGFITRKKISQGEPLQNSAEMLIRIKDDQVVLPDDGTIDRRFFIPSFKRATSISVDSEGAVGNTLRSGDLVDVIFTPRVSPGEEAFSVTLLQNVRVFDVAEIDSDKRGQKGTWQNITLLLSPQEAQDLALAKRYGFIDLTLVPEDAVPVDLRPTFTGHILPLISPEEAAPEEEDAVPADLRPTFTGHILPLISPEEAAPEEEDAVPADLRPTFTGHILPLISPEEATPENKISGGYSEK